MTEGRKNIGDFLTHGAFYRLYYVTVAFVLWAPKEVEETSFFLSTSLPENSETWLHVGSDAHFKLQLGRGAVVIQSCLKESGSSRLCSGIWAGLQHELLCFIPMKIRSLEFSHGAWSSDSGVWQVMRPHARSPVTMLLSARALAGRRRDELLDWGPYTVWLWVCHTDLILITWGCREKRDYPLCFSSTVPWSYNPDRVSPRPLKSSGPSDRESESLQNFLLSAFWFLLHFSPFGLFLGIPRPCVAAFVSLFLGVPGSSRRFSSSDIIPRSCPRRPLQALPQRLVSLLFLKSACCHYCCFFWDTSSGGERFFFPCDYSSFFQFWLVWRLSDYSSLGLLKLEGTFFFMPPCFYFLK